MKCSVQEIECDTCGGTGETMSMVCYRGNLVEKTETCPDCNGEGIIEIEGDTKMQEKETYTVELSLDELKKKKGTYTVKEMYCPNCGDVIKDFKVPREYRLADLNKKDLLCTTCEVDYYKVRV